jgi:hypothetical protein
MRFITAASIAIALFATASSHGAPVYSENFEVNPTANWTVNNNGLGTNAADFFFNYSTLGIPSAPNSTGGTTRGLKIGANLSSATAPATGIPGISASPTGRSFTGDYELRFDWWQNYFGPLLAGGTGSTMLSTFGILTSGTTPNLAGAADGVFFAATGEGGSSADFRVYSSQNPASHAAPDPGGFATYAAGDRNSSAALYQTTFPAGFSAPALQQTNFPASQTGMTPAGGTGFRWHDVRIRKLGTNVTWTVDGVQLASINTAGFTTPTAGTNILFGSSDINSTTNTSADFATLAFTLIDNVRVEIIPEPSTAILIVSAVLGAMVARRQRARLIGN